MDLKPGSRWRSGVSDAEVIIVRGPSDSVEIGCGGSPMVPFDAQDGETGQISAGLEGPALLGKRYVDQPTGLELLCTKAGEGTLTCDGRVMSPKDAKPLPSSD